MDTSFGALVERFLHDFGTRKPSPNTIAAYRRDLHGVSVRLAEAAGLDVDHLELVHLTKPALRAAFASWATDHASASVRRAWSAWNALFDSLVADDLVDGNPMAAITAPKSVRGRAKVIQGDDVIGRLLRTAAQRDERARHPWPARDLALAATFVVTGVRLSEAVDMDIGSLEGPAGARRIVVTGKGEKTRAIPIEPAYEQLLFRYLDERALRFPRHQLDHPGTPLFVRADDGERPSRQQVQYLIEKLYRRAALRGQVPKGALVHALRHTFATSALDHGIDVVELQELLGHASLDTTRRYLDATGQQLREAVRAHPAQAAVRDAVGDAGQPAPAQPGGGSKQRNRS